jgi:large subunit ribosomal protein L9
MANVEVILLERVPKLGQMGDIVKVKPGFARNYLLPEKKALRATADNRKYFDSRRKDLEASNLKRKQEAEAVAAQMAGFQVVLIRQASESLQLYGSVTARDIADAAATGSNNKAIKLERSQVELPKPIKSLGTHKVQVHLHPEVVVEITANVARSADEAEFQAKGGVIMAETDRAAQEAALAQAAAEAAAQALFDKPADAEEAAVAPEGEEEAK